MSETLHPLRRAIGWRHILLIAAGLTAAVVGILGVHTVGRLQGWFIERTSPEELSALLSPGYIVAKPPGDGPFPTALLYHGCDGLKDNMDRWTEALVASGWAAIVVDSHGPRGYADDASWRLVCTGQLLPGPERAGDVLVSMADAARMPFVDPDRLALVGMSHGGWTIMELLALAPPAALPVNLAAMPRSLSGLDGVVAAVLVYPWCGLANRARFDGWDHDAPVLFVLAELDVIAPAFECELLAGTLEAMGRNVEVTMHEGVTHGFDQEERAVGSILVYDAEATAASIARSMEFLDAAIAPDPS